jgi:hypothetical protein
MTATQPDWSNIGKSDGAKYFVDYLDSNRSPPPVNLQPIDFYKHLGT